jgi:hypothetical protein
MTTTTSKLGADMTDEHPAAKKMREQFEAKYGDMSNIMRAINGYCHTVGQFRRPYNSEFEDRVTNADLEKAEADMLASIRTEAAVLARQPAAIDKDATGDIEEAREILENMVRSIELDGNYSTEATCTFLRQALNCLPVAAPLANEASKPAPSVEQIIQAHAGEAQANLDRDALKTWWKGRDAEFKNFHHALCERFDYVHDEKDWKRDQVSLIEWIAKRLAPAAPSVEQDERGACEVEIKKSAWTRQTEARNAFRDGWSAGRAFEARAASTSANVAQGAKLSVWYGSMPESNGKTDWTAILHKGDIAEGITIDRSEYPDRVRYEADRMRWMIGEIDKEPWILDYDADKHSGYAAPPAQTALSDDARECLMDVVSHHHDFRTACIEIKAANETTRSDELYWQKQIDVLDRMKWQAERALKAAQSASASEGE